MLQGAQFKIVTLPSPPYITKMESLNPSKTEFKMEGLFAEVWFNLQYVMNFTYYLSKPPDGEWGAIQSDGTWSGMVNELQQQRADMGNI